MAVQDHDYHNPNMASLRDIYRRWATILGSSNLLYCLRLDRFCVCKEFSMDVKDMPIKVGDILFAKWLYSDWVDESSFENEVPCYSRLVHGRHVIVTATDAVSVTVTPVEPSQVGRFQYDGQGHPVARTPGGTVIVLMPCQDDPDETTDPSRDEAPA